MAEFIEVVSGGGGSGTVTSVNNVQPVSGNVTLVAGDVGAYTKDEIDAKTNVIYTSNFDEFNDSSKIQTNTNCVIDNGKIRPLFTNYADNGTNINNLQTSSGVDVVNGVVDVVSGDVGYDATTNTYNTHKYTTEMFTLQNATEIAVTPNITSPATGIDGFTSIEQIASIASSGSTEVLVSGFYDGVTGKNSYVSFNISTNPHSLKYHYYDSIVGDYSTVGLTYNGVQITTALSDTHIRNLSVVTFGVDLYIAYPASNSTYKVKKFNTVGRTENATEMEISIAGATIAQKIDMTVLNNRLHIITSFGLTASREVRYYYKTLAPENWNGSVDVTQQLVTTTTLSSFFFSVKFASDTANNRLGWCAFYRTTTTHFGIIDTTQSGYVAYRTPISSTSYNTNACGTMLYDSPNNRFIIMSGNGVNVNLSFFRVANSTSATLLGIVNLAGAFASMNNRHIEALFVPGGTSTRNFDVIFSNATRTQMYRVRVTSPLTADFSITGTSTNTTLFTSTSTTPLGAIQIVPNPDYNNSSIMTYSIVSRVENGLYLQELKNNIKPTIRLRVVNANEVAVPGTTTYNVEHNVSKTITFSSAQNSVALQFEFYYPVLKSTWDSASSPKPLSVDLNSYVLEQTAPTVSNATPRSFTSKILISDRLVKSVTLFADVTQGLVGNSVSFEVSAKGGVSGSFVSINNNGTIDLASDKQGTDVVLKTTFTLDNNADSTSDLPSIERYQVNVPNVVLTSDIYPLQINMMKLALQTNTLIQWNKTDFKNMFVDTFNYTDQTAFTANYTTTGDIQFNVSDKSVGSNSTSGVLESNTETADISAVSSILVLAESSIPFGSMGVADNYISISRNGGSDWYDNVPINEIFVFTGNETVKNQIRIKANMRFNVVYGWSYLYN